jgi:hypothetical protein
VSVPCKICETKRARRHCPGVGEEICPQCCGAQRENTIDCPLDCRFLREARLRERPPELDESQLPNRDIKVSETFIRDHETLVLSLALALRRSIEVARAVDFDAREALESAVRTLRTRESGLIYESRPQNPYAAGIQAGLTEAVGQIEKMVGANAGIPIRDTDVLGSLVFLQRLELQHNNGRRRGRAFLDFLTRYLPEPEAPAVIV